MRLKISNHEFNEFSTDFEKKLNLMAEHVLSDQREDNLNINLKFVSSSEMKKLNKEFRKEVLIQCFIFCSKQGNSRNLW